MYTSCGFHVENIHADREFKCIEANMLPVNMSITDADDHHILLVDELIINEKC